MLYDFIFKINNCSQHNAEIIRDTCWGSEFYRGKKIIRARVMPDYLISTVFTTIFKLVLTVNLSAAQDIKKMKTIKIIVSDKVAQYGSIEYVGCKKSNKKEAYASISFV